jgi:hypothetical protein
MRVFRKFSIRFAYQHLHTSIDLSLTPCCLALAIRKLRISHEIFQPLIIPISAINDPNFSGVGAGHAREPLYHGHIPLLRLISFLMAIEMTSSRGRHHA